MSTIQHLRELINERLAAAAEEIFTEFEKTIVQYEDVIDRQRRLLDISWKPQIKLRGTSLPQHHVSKEVEVLIEQQLYNQERHSSVEQEEPSGSQEGEQLVLRDTTEAFTMTAGEESDHSEPDTDPLLSQDLPHHVHKEEEVLAEQQLWNQERSFSLDQEEPEHPQIKEEQEEPEHPQIKEEQEEPEHPQIKEEQEELFSILEGEQLGLREEPDTFMMTATYEESDHSEPESDTEQLLSDCFIVAESRKQVTKKVDPGRSSSKVNEPLICDACGEVFRYMSQLKTHYRNHTGEKLFPCEMCSEMLISQGSLAMHIKDHLLEKPYACTMCEKKFAYYGKLMDHKNTHTGERPYVCNVCNRTFGQRPTFMKHLQTHRSVKPYHCKTCGKSFRLCNLLSKHKLSHTMQKPYRCETCRKIFKSGYNLLRHMKNHTK